MTDLDVGDQLVLELFDKEEIAVAIVRELSAREGRAFSGQAASEGSMLDCVVLVRPHGLIVDVTDAAHGRVWQVVSDENGVLVREVKSIGVQCPADPLHPPEAKPFVAVVDEGQSVTNQQVHAAVPKLSSSVVASVNSSLKASASALPTVDILVAYDSDAAAWAVANGGGIGAFAETCVQKMNVAIANTGLDSKFSFRLVGTYEIGGSAGGSLNYAVGFASGTYQGTLNNVSWAGVSQKRDELAADIVCVLIDTRSDAGTTGVGYSLISSTVDPASCGYNACAIRAVAAGHTMTHEVGHNMGAGHSDAMADKDNCGPQYHPYSSGYYFHIGNAGYYTIMAYNTDGYGNNYTAVPYFSSPDHCYNATPVGDSTHDNSKTVGELCATVANNRRPPTVIAALGVGTDCESYTWTTDGTYPWALSTDIKSDGVDSVSSSLVPMTGTSWMETKVVGPATLSFNYLLRSYGGSLQVTCDGTSLFEYGGATQAIYMNSWGTASSLSIPSGTHTIRFAHVNSNTSYYSPANAVWIDKVVFAGGSPYQPIITTYAISFNANGGTPTPASITRNENAEYGELPMVTRTGYAFVGWFTSASGGTQVTSATKATANATLYAHWSPVSYSISYELNGGANAAGNPASYTIEDAVTLATPTRTGYTFSGWSPNNGVIALGSTGNKTFTANWTLNVAAYTISFNANGGTPTPASITRNENAEYGTLPMVTRTGYAFVGWFTSASGGTQVTSATKATANATLYAHWEKTGVSGGKLVHEGYVPVNAAGLIWQDVDLDDIVEYGGLMAGAAINDGIPLVADVYHVKKTTQGVNVQFQVVDDRYVKCVNVLFSQQGKAVYGKVVYARYAMKDSVAIGADFDTISSTEYTKADDDAIAGYGVKDVEAILRNSALMHRWSFNGNLLDSVSGETATAVGSVTTDGKQYQLSGNRYGTAYLNLGEGLLPDDGSSFTIEIWATQDIIKNYSRLISIGTASRESFYQEWTQGDSLEYDEVLFGGINHASQSQTLLAPYSLGIEYHISAIFTQVSGNWKVRLYKRDSTTGEILKSWSADAQRGWSITNMVYDSICLGHPLRSGSESDANASYNEVRIWNRALTDDELTANVLAGPNADLTFRSVVSYSVHFDGNGGAGTMSDLFCVPGKIYALPKNAFTNGTKKFMGWQCSNQKRYDDEMLVYDLVAGGQTVTMTAIWE